MGNLLSTAKIHGIGITFVCLAALVLSGADVRCEWAGSRVLSGAGGLPCGHCRALAGGGHVGLATGLAGREGDPEAALAQAQAEQAT